MWLTSEQASAIPAKTVEAKIGASFSQGLSSLEVSRRRDIHGFNEVDVGKPDPVWKKYIDQFNNPFILLLLPRAEKFIAK